MLRTASVSLAALIALLPAAAQEAEPPVAPPKAEAAALTDLEALDIASAVTEAVVEAVEQVEAVDAVEAVAQVEAAPAVEAAAQAEADATVAEVSAQAEVEEIVIVKDPRRIIEQDSAAVTALTDEQAIALLTNADPADAEDAAAPDTMAAAVDVVEGAAQPVLPSASDDLNAAALSALQAPAAAVTEVEPAAAPAAPVMKKMEVERRVVRNEAGDETTSETVTLTAPDGTVTTLQGAAAKAAIEAAGLKADVAAAPANAETVKVEVRIHKEDGGPGKVDIQAEGANVTQTASEDGKSRVIVISGAEENDVRITISRE